MNGSDYISTKQAKNIIGAIVFARRIGLPLNEFLTIQWSQADPGEVPAGRLKVFFDRGREWLRRRGLELTYIYVHERGDLGHIHSHVMIHVPAEHWFAFDSMMCPWMDTGRHDGLIDAQPVHDELGLGRYLLKGVEPSAWSRSWKIQTQEQGRIPGKRCGTSENIGAAARARYTACHRRQVESGHVSQAVRVRGVAVHASREARTE